MTEEESILEKSLPLLYEAESFLRRHLQSWGPEGSDDGTGDELDPNMYTHSAQEASEENSQSKGRTVLTILYLCVLGLCFIVPVFYYFRLHCFEEHARRELEMDFTHALEQSEMHREESRAARRKYIEERRARIVQLLGPVRLILKEDNFPDLEDLEHGGSNSNTMRRAGSFLNLDFESEKFNKNATKSGDESATMTSEDVLSPYTSDDDDNDNVSHDNHNINNNHTTNDNKANNENGGDKNNNTNDNEPDSNMEEGQRGGVIETKSEYEEEDNSTNVEKDRQKDRVQHNPYGDEDSFQVLIPVPGLPMGGSCFLDHSNRPQSEESSEHREMRLAPGLCTICLCNYKVGSDVVWSSNEKCDHAFHFSCIERWLMKQREGPLCPICRRDFIVDPFDLLEEEENNNNNDAVAGVEDGQEAGSEIPMMYRIRWDPGNSSLRDSELDQFGGPSIVTAPGETGRGRNNTRNRDGFEDGYDVTSYMEEGLQAPSIGVAGAVEDADRNVTNNN